MRLNKYLALCGIGSRRACDALIRQGMVQVNQKAVLELGMQVDSKQDEVTYSGKKVVLSKKRYFLFYKPTGVLTTHSDPFERPHIGDFLKDVQERIFSVGRLDGDSEGLLLLTNDGDIAHRLQHPRYKVPKTYHIWTNRELSPQEQQIFREGIALEEGQTHPADIRRLREKEYEVVLKQGWNRQIRRMIESLGANVVRLKRTAIGKFQLENLQPGEKREIPAEIFFQKIKKD